MTKNTFVADVTFKLTSRVFAKWGHSFADFPRKLGSLHQQWINIRFLASNNSSWYIICRIIFKCYIMSLASFKIFLDNLESACNNHFKSLSFEVSCLYILRRHLAFSLEIFFAVAILKFFLNQFWYLFIICS